jgi:putative membrane protein
MRCVSGLTALLVLAGCTSQGSEAAERRADTARRRDSIAGVAAGSMTENNIVALLELTHAADSALGSLGAANGSTTAIKEFGRMISREHHALRKDAEEVAARLGLTAETPRVPPDEPPAAMRDSVVNAAPGGAWDRAYLDYAIAVHRSAMENTARALAATKQPEVKSFIEKSVPIIQKHLDKAQSLQKNLK